jgi:hypothetical protein
MASISRKLSNKVPITIFQMLLAGRHTHKNRAFYGFEGVLWVWIMGSQNVMCSFYGSNISVSGSRFKFEMHERILQDTYIIRLDRCAKTRYRTANSTVRFCTDVYIKIRQRFHAMLER